MAQGWMPIALKFGTFASVFARAFNLYTDVHYLLNQISWHETCGVNWWPHLVNICWREAGAGVQALAQLCSVAHQHLRALHTTSDFLHTCRLTTDNKPSHCKHRGTENIQSSSGRLPDVILIHLVQKVRSLHIHPCCM